MKCRLIFLVTMFGALTLTGCSISRRQFVDLDQRVSESREKGRAVDASFREMSASDLLDALGRDSLRGVEPFNSRAYDEAVRRGPVFARDLGARVREGNRESFLGLIALRSISRERYEQVDPQLRVRVLIDALAHSRFFNVWGLPHLYWEEPALALIAEGRRAVPALTRLLDDRRPAPVWGDEEAMVYRLYQYRVRDYAWALLVSSENRDLSGLPRDPAERDALIRP